MSPGGSNTTAPAASGVRTIGFQTSTANPKTAPPKQQPLPAAAAPPPGFKPRAGVVAPVPTPTADASDLDDAGKTKISMREIECPKK